MQRVLELARGWEYEAVAVGVPAQVTAGKVVHEPVNLGRGWAGFDFESAFGRPTTVVNDAAMQALGTYRGGRMLFLGLGTGLGSAFVVDGIVEPMELGHLPYRKSTYEDYVSTAARKRQGRTRWHRSVREVVEFFIAALEPDEIVVGGGNAEELDPDTLPPRARLGDNADAFAGGFRLWGADDTAKPFVRHPESIVAVIRQGDGVVVVRQERRGAGRTTHELPQEKLEPGESPEAGAVRGLAEECGLTAVGWRRLTSYYAAPAYSTQLVHAFAAEAAGEVPRRPEDEEIEVRVAPLSELPGLLDDAISIAAFECWREEGGAERA